MKKVYNYLTILSLFIGLLIGFLLPSFATNIAFLGKHYINILKIIIGPVIFVSLAVSIINSKRGESKFVLKTVGLFILMFIVTFLLTSLIVGIIKPGSSFVSDEIKDPSSSADFTILSIFKNLLPKTLKGFLMGGNIFFVILLSLFISLIFKFTPLKETYGNVMGYIKKILDIILKIIIYLTPIAVISLISNMVVMFGNLSIKMGIIYIVMAYICSVIALIVVMIIPVWLIAKINPLEYIKKVSKVWLVSLTTCSSVATLPHTIKCCNEDFNINEKITSVVVPLGCTIHMCGGAVSFSLLGLFVSQLSNISITLPLFILMIISATLINMAAPGIPGGGVVIGFTYLSLLGLPINTFYGFYSGVYKLLDMPYTTLNVTGDISANILLNHNN